MLIVSTLRIIIDADHTGGEYNIMEKIIKFLFVQLFLLMSYMSFILIKDNLLSSIFLPDVMEIKKNHAHSNI